MKVPTLFLLLLAAGFAAAHHDGVSPGTITGWCFVSLGAAFCILGGCLYWHEGRYDDNTGRMRLSSIACVVFAAVLLIVGGLLLGLSHH